MNRQIYIPLIDPLDVLMSNIEHQLSLWDKDGDIARLADIARMETIAWCIEYGFRTNMN